MNDFVPQKKKFLIKQLVDIQSTSINSICMKTKIAFLHGNNNIWKFNPN